MSVCSKPNICIVMCKNKRSAKILFERACEVSDKAGDEFKVDRKYLAMKYESGITIRFVSAIDYYTNIQRGYEEAIVIGDKEMDRNIDELEKHLKEATDE